MNNFCSTKTYSYIFFIIIILASISRFYQLGLLPAGMAWDEAAIGYNGFAIFNARRDEWLSFMPISFQSFGDYKAPLAIYLNGIFTWAFGMSLWAVRLPFALSGIISVGGFIALINEILKKNSYFNGNEMRNWYALAAGGLIAMSPWHIHFSRLAFESGLALMFVIWGIYFYWRWLKAENEKSQKWKLFANLTTSAILLTLSLYSYHSSKIVVPLLVLLLLLAYGPGIKELFRGERFKSGILAGILTLIGIGPLLWDAYYGRGLERAGVTLFSQGLSWPELIEAIFQNLYLHLSVPFLIGGLNDSLRHSDGVWGVLLPTTWILFWMGIFGLFITYFFRRSKFSLPLLGRVGFWWLIIGLLPAIITTEVPHANRLLLALPGFLMVALGGLEWMLRTISYFKWNLIFVGSKGEESLLSKAVVGLLVMMHLLFFISYLNHYFTEYPHKATSVFNEGYIEAFQLAHQYELGFNDLDPVDQILFSSDYQHPYIYALFVRKTNPIWYHGGSLIKYLFLEEINIGDLARPNTLIVASGEDEMPLERADHIIYGKDGSVRFALFVTDKM